MAEPTTALLVHQNAETMIALKFALERQGMRLAQAGSRAAAKRMLAGLAPVPLVFTDTHLPDGTWADILAAAEGARRPVNVIVVARTVDTRFYVEAIETGAFDFIAPPFNATDLAYVVRSALENALGRRAAMSLPTSPSSKSLESETTEVGTPVASS